VCSRVSRGDRFSNTSYDIFGFRMNVNESFCFVENETDLRLALHGVTCANFNALHWLYYETGLFLNFFKRFYVYKFKIKLTVPSLRTSD